MYERAIYDSSFFVGKSLVTNKVLRKSTYSPLPWTLRYKLEKYAIYKVI